VHLCTLSIIYYSVTTKSMGNKTSNFEEKQDDSMVDFGFGYKLSLEDRMRQEFELVTKGKFSSALEHEIHIDYPDDFDGRVLLTGRVAHLDAEGCMILQVDDIQTIQLLDKLLTYGVKTANKKELKLTKQSPLYKSGKICKLVVQAFRDFRSVLGKTLQLQIYLTLELVEPSRYGLRFHIADVIEALPLVKHVPAKYKGDCAVCTNAKKAKTASPCLH
jgi:hypothetical protein